MTFQTEFPDFPVADMPTIPDGFEDASWKNDACPCFINLTLGLMMFVDFADTAKREIEDSDRFSLSDFTEEGGPGIQLVSTNDWSEVLTAIAGHQT